MSMNFFWANSRTDGKKSGAHDAKNELSRRRRAQPSLSALGSSLAILEQAPFAPSESVFTENMDFKPQEASYYLVREKLSIGSDPAMSRRRSNLFIFLSHNSMDAASLFDILSNQIIEVGAQLQL
jgi:hypothetical protein